VELSINRNKFRGPVVGPIGKYLKICSGREHLGNIAELSLGNGVLDRFIVTNDADRSLFMKLRQEIGCASHDCGLFQLNNGPRYEIVDPPPGVEVVSTVLNVTNDLIFNCLVDNCRIDQVALMTSKRSSEDALLMEQNGQYYIRGGIKMVYFLPNGDYWAITNGTRSMTSNDRQLKQRIGLDRSGAIRDAENELTNISEELKILRVKEANLVREHRQYKIYWNKANKDYKETQIVIRNIDTTIEEIKAETEEAENITTDTSDLEDDVRQAEEAYELVQVKKKENEKAVEDLLPHVDYVKNHVLETSARNEKVSEDINQTEMMWNNYMRGLAEKKRITERKRTQVEQTQSAREQQLDNIKTREESRNKARVKAQQVTFTNRKAKEERKKKVGEKEKKIDEHNKFSLEVKTESDTSFEEHCIELEKIEPIYPEKDSIFYKNKILRIEREIVKERDRRKLREIDPTVVLRKYQSARQDLESKMLQIFKIKDDMNMLIDDIKDRKKLWKQFRNHIDLMTNEIFDEMLNKKGSSGHIDFNHEKKRLNLLVQKDFKNENMSPTADIKSLSGGERTYTTLALLIALGENLETPFRVMDEFDVFLDHVSRKIALDTMIAVAKDMQHRQFFFITPQDLSNIPTDPMLKIFQLKPPERSNIVGGISQQTLDF